MWGVLCLPLSTSCPGCSLIHHTNQFKISFYLPRGFSHYSLNPGIMRFLSEVISGLIFREDAVICPNSVSWQGRNPPLAGLLLGGFWHITQADLKNWMTLLCQNFNSYLLSYIGFSVSIVIKIKNNNTIGSEYSLSENMSYSVIEELLGGNAALSIH